MTIVEIVNFEGKLSAKKIKGLNTYTFLSYEVTDTMLYSFNSSLACKNHAYGIYIIITIIKNKIKTCKV